MRPVLFAPLLGLFLTPIAYADTRFVDAVGTNPSPPYLTWSTAAVRIQDALDVCAGGDEVVVTNGVYATGGRAVYGTMTNRVVITNAVVLRSVNGPRFTIIEGRQLPTTTNGDGAVRCVYLAGGAVLSGFTVTNGATRMAGDYAWEQMGGGILCSSGGGTVTNCVITRNAASNDGGGIAGGNLWDCIIDGNLTVSGSGGGTQNSVVNRCLITNNRARSQGGGAYLGTLTNTTVTRNWAGSFGGGVAGSTLTAQNCLITENTAVQEGGGAEYSTLRNCALSGNSAETGGGVYGAKAYNCTLTGNSAGLRGGGGWGSSYYNCIVYYNRAWQAPNYGGSLNYSCTTPLPSSGMGNIADPPELLGAYRISLTSPCRGAGSASYATGVDVDGETWLGPPSMGCDEVVAGSLTGLLSVAAQAAYTNIAVGFAAPFAAEVHGQAAMNRWDFGDGATAANQAYTYHAWLAPGLYPVVLTVYNDTFPAGLSATTMVQVVEQPVHYVNAGGPTPAPPYTTWATAANTIQPAVDAATIPGSLVLVTNGTYNTGGRVAHGQMFNRVAVTNPITVSSVNGPLLTRIQGRRDFSGSVGDGAIRGVYLTDGARLSGFTITNSATRSSSYPVRESTGGGVFCEPSAVVENCILVTNVSQSGGGLSGGAANNCVFAGNTGGSGAGAYNATLTSCTLTTNNASGSGGGAASAVLNDCLLAGNRASSGGGTSGGLLNRCTLSNNVAQYEGGGANQSTLRLSLVSSNYAQSGGGAYGGTLDRCVVVSNAVSDAGGGVASATVQSCALQGNFALYAGGGVNAGTTLNCTIVANRAGVFGGGAAGGNYTNCIVWHNSAPNGENYKAGTWGTVFHSSCTTPMPESGAGNIAADPGLASATHIGAWSPCRGRGVQVGLNADIDSESWGTPPSIGCDEHTGGPITGPLTAAIQPAFTNVAVNWPLEFAADIRGNAIASRWEFGDGVVVSNRAFCSHAWVEPGDYTVVLRAYNDSFPQGITASQTIRVLARPVHYVSPVSPAPVYPFSSWIAAARSIQDAVDAATVPGSLVLVTNGLYAAGGRAVWGNSTNRLVIPRPIVVQSVNGPGVTAIEGYQTPGVIKGLTAIRCVHLGRGALLSGFTLTNGATQTIAQYSELEPRGGALVCESVTSVASNCVLAGSAGMFGGGAFSGTLVDCTVTGNSANFGGGAHSSTLVRNWIARNAASQKGGGIVESLATNCVLMNNISTNDAGGANLSLLNNCTLTGNSATNYGSGATESTLLNSIIYFNNSRYGGQNYDSALRNCCTPHVFGGVNSFTNEPRFVDVQAGNLRLQPSSPCINAGDNAWTDDEPDLDGNPRHAGGTVDIGAYEMQSPGSSLSFAWAQQYGFPTDGSADLQDQDGDGLNNLGEWIAGTDPTNNASSLRILRVTAAPATIVWSSVTNRSYVLERSTGLVAPTEFAPLMEGIPGQSSTTSFTDTNNVGPGPMFYRVGVPDPRHQP